jgi:hypothetical protein
MQLSPEEERLWQIFHPYAAEQHAVVLSKNTRFVHYTRTEAAMSILKNREVWMRKSICMNDFMEVRFGLGCLIATYHHSEAGQRLKSLLDQLFEGLRSEVETLFDQWTNLFIYDSYFTCFSEHLDKEDRTGRLSMWRAYGATNGVALVVNNAPFLTRTDALKTSVSPVAYVSAEEFPIRFARIVDNMAVAVDFLKEQGREITKNYVFNMLRFAAVCTKHPGFEEEKEWRVIYSPSFQKSERLNKAIKEIQGAPQLIYKIALKDIPEEGLTGIEIPALLDRIIIGPTQYGPAIWEAFKDLLDERGVENAGAKIVVSDYTTEALIHLFERCQG